MAKAPAQKQTQAAQVMAEMNKAFKKDVLKLGSDVPSMRYWPTGILPIDWRLGGGLPVGRFIEWYGDYSTLKSYVAYKTIASVQKLGGTVALVDSEKAWDADWGRAIGVDTDNLLLMNEGAEGGALVGEEVIAVMEILLRNKYDLIVWDSIASTQPKQYAEKKPGEDLQPGGQARMMSAGLRRLTSVNMTSTILAINQTRVNVGMTYGGSKDSVPGGKAMSFYASFRLRAVKAGRDDEEIQIWKGEKLETSRQMVKQRIKLTLEKSKLSSPNREVWFEFDLRKNEVDEVAWLVGWAVENGYVTITSKSWYSIDDLKVNGREKFITAMREQKEVLEWMREEVKTGFLEARPGNQP